MCVAPALLTVQSFELHDEEVLKNSVTSLNAYDFIILITIIFPFFSQLDMGGSLVYDGKLIRIILLVEWNNKNKRKVEKFRVENAYILFLL